MSLTSGEEGTPTGLEVHVSFSEASLEQLFTSTTLAAAGASQRHRWTSVLSKHIERWTGAAVLLITAPIRAPGCKLN